MNHSPHTNKHWAEPLALQSPKVFRQSRTPSFKQLKPSEQHAIEDLQFMVECNRWRLDPNLQQQMQEARSWGIHYPQGVSPEGHTIGSLWPELLNEASVQKGEASAQRVDAPHSTREIKQLRKRLREVRNRSYLPRETPLVVEDGCPRLRSFIPPGAGVSEYIHIS